MSSGVTACIPTIPPRRLLLQRAIVSVLDQTLPAAALVVVNDVDREGVWVMRSRAARMAETEFIAQLDDDDQWLEVHLERLVACQREHDADMVFSWFHGPDVLGHFGKPFDPANPHLTTSTVLLRTDLARQVRYGPPDPAWSVAQDDWLMVQEVVRLGGKIVHLPERTWIYEMGHGAHTSGLPSRW